MGQVWGWGLPWPARCVATMADCPCCHSGADDLLPILSYVVLQTGLPQLLSECAALEEFIHEGYVPAGTPGLRTLVTLPGQGCRGGRWKSSRAEGWWWL